MIVDASENNEAGNYRINNNKTRISKSFECKTKITGNTPANNHRLNTEVVCCSIRIFELFLEIP